MKGTFVIAVLVGLVAISSATVYFSEKFDKGWEDRWVHSDAKKSEGSQGEWKWTAGKFHSADNEEEEKGIQTSPDARFYQTSAKTQQFSNKGKDLVLQYSVKHEQGIDCGGGYIKILPSGLNQKSFGGDSTYNVMFGPDICGSTRKTHFILTKDGVNHLVKREIRTETDEFTHLYTLILHPDNTYEVQIDGKEAQKGSLKEDFEILKSKEIKDPSASKPEDWVNEKTIADPEDKKPEGYDDIPETIPDPDATKPDDWEDELDGEWERPTIANPEYKGEWSAKQIPNPAYKGEWVHPMVPNPEFVDRDDLYLFEDNNFVGFELWQVKSGTIFDNIIVTDDLAEAQKFAELTTKAQKGEKDAHDAHEKVEAEKRAAEEEKNKANEAADEDDDEEEEKESKENKETEEKEDKDEL
eukprot:TRINITY_DN1112_c0_g1_i4.p1 TRINITY_DN1112_c0_g1~~TRINITY_DN1112_c0_g1_i4.p1  ORF type:complete len:412 (+),score=170.08 TRINITY_DN1112_c0_g1_i4:98-1333(+)